VAKVLVILAFSLAFLPLKIILLFIFWEAFTRQTRFRQESTERLTRRVREWWYSIPVVPVRLLKVEDEKKKKS
jgi:predicted CDP-diglyceride synthetase/phosphatidate cytidylyltransferase